MAVSAGLLCCLLSLLVAAAFEQDTTESKTVVPDIEIRGSSFVVNGQTLKLQCRAHGSDYPPDAVDWFKDGRKITSADRVSISSSKSPPNRTIMSTLVIDRTSTSDAGTYVCRSSDLRVTSAKVHITDSKRTGNNEPEETSKVKPSIKLTGSSYVEEGESLRLVCNATGADRPPDVVEWFKDGEKIGPFSDVTMTVQQDGNILLTTLLILEATTVDSGTYVCRSSDLLVDSAKVIVIDSNRANKRRGQATGATQGPRDKIQLMGSSFVEKGQALRLVCTASGQARPPAGVDWFKDGQKLRTSERMSITDIKSPAERKITSTLLLPRTHTTDTGTYVCRTSNEQIESLKVTILETEDPNIKRGGGTGLRGQVQLTGRSYVEKGQALRLVCTASGQARPPAEVDWFKDGQHLRSSERMSITDIKSPAERKITSTLLLPRTRITDTGTYVCRTSDNRLESLQVTILQAEFPNIKRGGGTGPTGKKIQLTGSSFVDKGQALRLVCTASGQARSPAGVDWFKDRQKLRTSERMNITDIKSPAERKITSTLVLPRTLTTDTGTYVCRTSDKQIKSLKVTILETDGPNIKRGGGTAHGERKSEDQYPETTTMYTVSERPQPTIAGPRAMDESSALQAFNSTFTAPILNWLKSSTKVNWAQVKLIKEQVKVAKLTRQKLSLEIARLKKQN